MYLHTESILWAYQQFYDVNSAVNKVRIFAARVRISEVRITEDALYKRFQPAVEVSCMTGEHVVRVNTIKTISYICPHVLRERTNSILYCTLCTGVTCVHFYFCLHLCHDCICPLSFLQKSIFEGIAQEALSECVKSLCSASTAIRSIKVCSMYIL